MNALGICYLGLAGVATVYAGVHLAQAIVIRSDRTQAVLALVCLGFGLFDLGIAFSSEHTGAGRPAWVGWHVLAAAAAAMLTVVVPMTAWLVLEVRGRTVALIGVATLGLVRLVGVIIAVHDAPSMTWEQLHSLDHAFVAVPSIACALVGGGSWIVEGALARRRAAPYATPMLVFGCMGAMASLHGIGVTLGVVSPPDLFGLMTLPAVGFVQVLSSVRFIRALQTATQPAGDIGRYEVLARLGAGGMGEVFLARRRGPAGFLRQVVLKTLQASDSALERERFVAEARVAAQLHHPNIVDVYDLGVQPSGLFIVMEHIEGMTLDEILALTAASTEPIGSDVVAEIGVQICRALSFAHAAQVLHRDIKPQNIMISVAGVLKVIDFGIAKELVARAELPAPGRPAAAPGLTASGRVIGTLGYIAPERYEGEPASVGSDLFAVGVVLYELIAARSPYATENEHAFLAAIAEHRVAKLATLRGDVTPKLVEAIEQCLEPSIARRPASAASLQAMLEGALQGRRVELAAWITELDQRGEPSGARLPPDHVEAAATLPSRATSPARRRRL